MTSLSVTARIPEPIPRVQNQTFLFDIGIVGGFVVVFLVIDRAGSYVGPWARSIFARVVGHGINSPYWIQIREGTSNIYRELWNAVSSLRDQRHRPLRWFASHIPSFLFPTNQRIRICAKTSNQAPNLEAELGIIGRQRPRLTTSFRNVPDSLVGDLDFGFIDKNLAGVVVAFQNSDADAENFDSDLTDTDHTDFAYSGINFSVPEGRCSTPNSIQEPNGPQVSGKFRNVKLNSTFTVQEDSLAQTETNDRVKALETELNYMKEMVAQILQNQKLLVETSAAKNTFPNTPSFDSANATNVANSQNGGIPKAPSIPPPPPPPPPPMPLTTSKPNTISLKVCSGLRKPDVDTPAPKPSGPPSLTDVLKGLPDVKLKQVPRSPGGTPMKAKRSPDSGSLLAVALQKRFARIQSPNSSDDSYNDKENQKKDDSDDSFDKSPGFFKPSVKLLKPSGVCIRVPDVLSCHGLKKDAMKENQNVPQENSVPLFGQHLLKKRKSSGSRARLFTLREQSQNTSTDQ